MDEKIVCASCGAEYEKHLGHCPYCGTATIEADENEYMDKLEDVRKDLLEYSTEGTKKIKKGIGSTLLIAFVVLIVIASLIAGSIWLAGIIKSNDSQKKKEEFLKDQGITTSMVEETIYEM